MRPTLPKVDLPFTPAEWAFFAAVIAVNLALDAILMRVEHLMLVLSRGNDRYVAWVEGFAMAMLVTQLVVFAIWAALFEGSNLIRVLIATLAVCVAFHLLQGLAYAVAPKLIDYREWGRTHGLPMIIVIFFATQTPFWLLRFFFGWRVKRMDDTDSRVSNGRRFQMLHMLGWSAFLSLPLALSRLYYRGDVAETMYLVACVAVAPCILSVLYLWATLGAKNIAWGLIVCAAASIVLAIIGAQAMTLISPRAWGIVYQVAFVVLSAVTIVALGTGIAARAFGYRLRMRASAQ